MSTEKMADAATGATALEGSLIDEMLNETKLPRDDSREQAKAGLKQLLDHILRSERGVPQRMDNAIVDDFIAEIDKRISAQLNEIMHHPDFQKLESAWRGLKFMVDRVDFRENIRVEMLNASKETLAADFEDAPEVAKSGLYRLVYSNEYGVHGGKPYGLICSTYDFGPGPQDVALLSKCAAVATMAHAPFIGNAAPQFFGGDNFLGVPQLKDLKALFEGPQYTKWRAFRETEDARSVGLCMPRFLLRLPYDEKNNRVPAFNYNEDVVDQHASYLWGHASIALATRVADSFAKYRWCPNIIGPQAGGTVDNLPLHQYDAMGSVQTKIPTEILITERREYELSEEGFIALTYRKDADNACFFSANSVQKPKFFGNSEEGKQAETNYRLGTQLPYMFIMSRLAHYMKVLQREQIGEWKEKSDLERELNAWIGQYVADMEDPAPSVRSRRPLRSARIAVADVEGQPGWYRCSLAVRPHFKYMGASFTLSLVGKLDKA